MHVNVRQFMCWLCEDFDRYIAHYREIQGRAIDPLTSKSIEILILKAEAKKRELHPTAEHAPVR